MLRFCLGVVLLAPMSEVATGMDAPNHDCPDVPNTFRSTKIYLSPEETYRSTEFAGFGACATYHDLLREGHAVSVRSCGGTSVDTLLTSDLTCYRFQYEEKSDQYRCEMALRLRDGRIFGTVPNPCGEESVVGVRN